MTKYKNQKHQTQQVLKLYLSHKERAALDSGGLKPSVNLPSIKGEDSSRALNLLSALRMRGGGPPVISRRLLHSGKVGTHLHTCATSSIKCF